MSQSSPAPIRDFELLITASEAYPAFERLCLNATDFVQGGFRIFDLRTRLRSDAAKAVGETWFDLILHKLNQGVRFDFVITDFDPIVATVEHRMSWSTAQQFAALNELSTGAKITWKIAMHSARVGYLPRQLLQSKIEETLEETEQDELTPGLDGLEGAKDLPLVPATHHQKLAVIDGTSLYIGGLDLNERRYDTHKHHQAADQTWQDIQCIVRGPVVQAASEHLSTFLDVVAGRADPAPASPGFLRTLSRRRKVDLMHISPYSMVTELEEVHLDAIGKTSGPIYLESQFFRHQPIADALAERAAQCDDLVLMLVLPAAPDDVAFEGNRREDARFGAQKQLDALTTIRDAFGERVAIAAPAQPRIDGQTDEAARHYSAPMIYVHSKLSLFGVEQAVLSSANLNGRSMRWDTETGIHLDRSDDIAPIWPRMMGHWLGDPDIDPFSSPRDFIAKVNGRLDANANATPPDRRHFLLPYAIARDAELAESLPGVPDEIV